MPPLRPGGGLSEDEIYGTGGLIEFLATFIQDLVSGQIQAIGTAADASMVMLEMKKSLDVLTESMNQTTQFVSDGHGGL